MIGIHFLTLNIVGGDREARAPRGDRDSYKRKEDASGDFKPEFRGGLGKFLILEDWMRVCLTYLFFSHRSW